MKKKMLLPFLILLIIVELFLFVRSVSTVVKTSTGDIADEKKYWSSRIDDVGFRNAYQEFVDENSSIDIVKQHGAAHIIGELFYKKGGIEAIIYCGDHFSFGCYHSFFTKALSEKGIGIVNSLDEACTKGYGPIGLGCTHGIGHGLLEYLGHDKLDQALDICSSLTWQGPILGCSSGVFMEYNFPTLIDGNITDFTVRKLENGRIYAPCDQLKNKYTLSCYYEIPQWWDKIFESDFQKIGDLCSKITSKEEKEICYFGAGHEAVIASYFEVDETIGECQLMPEKIGKILCRAGASWGFSTMEQYKELAPSLCQGLTIDEEKQCRERADIFKDVEKYLKI